MIENNLKLFVKNDLIKKSEKLKGKFAPLSEIVDRIPKTITIKRIYNFKGKLKDYFLIVVKNYNKKPKIRYFLTYKLANQSSDLLVSLAKSYAFENELSLIQYSIYPKLIGRISLLTFKELTSVDDYLKILETFELFRNNFRKKLVKIKNLV